MYGIGGPLLVLYGLLILALIVLVVVLIIWLIRRMTANTDPPPQLRRDPAENDLRRRYAAGEIDQDDYRRRLADLRDGAPPATP